MSGKKVFISYSAADRETVDTFIRELKNQKIDYWTDQQMNSGEELVKQIETAIESASIYILFISSNFLSSNWSMFEMGLALSQVKKRKTVVPVLLNSSPVPEFLQQTQSIDANSTDPFEFAETIQKIIETA